MSEISMTELADKWQCSRTKIRIMVRAGAIRGAHMGIVGRQKGWLFPSDVTYEETGWEEQGKGNQYAQIRNGGAIQTGETAESYILRHEASLSTRQIAQDLGITSDEVRRIYDQLWEKYIKGGNTIEQ